MIRIGRGIIRGIALFFGVFSVLNILVSRLGTARGEDIWWISFRWLPSPAVTLLQVAAAVLLLLFALKPSMGLVRRWLTVGICVVYVAYASINTFDYYRLLAAGSFATSFPVPFSLFVVAVFVAVGLAAWRMHDKASSLLENITLPVCALAVALLFPFAQFLTFGHTDYARKADVAVVFGAHAYADGRLSTSLKDRVDRSITLYRDGLVDTLLFTGGIDASGTNEPEKMRDYAVDAGIPASAIVLDDGGSDTDRSVRNTAPMLREMGAKTVLAVSQFYHLPRIKMAYRGAHVNVLTVPASKSRPIPGTPWFTVRETVAFWAYWLRSGVRDLRLPWANALINKTETQLHEN
jgi:vancomycin permeability regulator SanA